MSCAWAITLHKTHAGSLGALRLLPGIDVAQSGDGIWVRGKTINDELDRELLKLPTQQRFEVIGQDQLRPVGSRIPTGQLPSLQWTPLAQWLSVRLPPAALAGEVRERVALQLVRSTQPREPTVFLTDLESWTKFATRAPEIRLRHLQFAVADDDRVLVKGSPLPSIPGKQFVDHDGVAVPVGFGWSPALDAAVVRRLFGVGEGGLAVWHEDGTLTLLSSEQFVPATRSAARMSMQREAA